MDFLEEIIYMHQSVQMDYIHYVRSFIRDYELDLQRYFAAFPVFAKKSEITYKFDLTWNPVVFRRQDFRWLEDVMYLVQLPVAKNSSLVIKKAQLSIVFSSKSYLELRIPYVINVELDNILKTIEQCSVELVNCNRVTYEASNIRFTVLRIKIPLGQENNIKSGLERGVEGYKSMVRYEI